MRRISVRLITWIIFSGLLVACGGGSGGDNSPGTGKVSVGVTDAAIDDAERVVVEFTAVELKPQSGSSILFTLDDPQQIDLLSVQGSEFEPLINAESVPSGQYNWIRLHMNDSDCNASLTGNNPAGSYIELTGGGLEPLHVPSGSQSGLKLNSGFVIAAGGQTDLTIDFDVRKSVTAPNGQDCHFLKPSLRLVDNAEIGHIAGSVDLTGLNAERCNSGVSVYLFEGFDAAADDISGSATDPITSAIVDQETADFEIGFVLSGDYTVALTCDGELDDPESDNPEVTFESTKNVTVSVGETTPVNF